MVTRDEAEQLAHARRPGMVGEPKAGESRRRGGSAEQHGARERGGEQARLAATPGEHVIDLEGDADAEQQRQRNDVGEVEREPEQNGELQGDDAGEQQRHERDENVGDPAQGEEQGQRDEEKGERAGLKEGAHDGLGRFLDEDRRARCIRRHLEHGRRKAPHRLVVVLIAFRPHLDPRLAVLADPIVAQILGQGGERHRLRVKARFDLFEPQLQSTEQRRLDGGTLGGIGVRQSFQRFPDRGACIDLAVGEKGRCGVVERRARLGIARRRLDLGRVERWFEQGLGVGDDGELLVLILGHEALQRERARDLGQLVKPRGEGRSLLDRRGEHVDHVRRGLRVLHQVEQGRDRLHRVAPQVEWIEVELEIPEERQPSRHRERGENEDRHAMARHETVDGSELAVAHGLRLGWWLEHKQKRRQQRDADDKGDDHPCARDQAELRHAAIVGGKKGIEARGRRGRGKRQRLCDLRRSRRPGPLANRP